MPRTIGGKCGMPQTEVACNGVTRTCGGWLRDLPIDPWSLPSRYLKCKVPALQDLAEAKLRRIVGGNQGEGDWEVKVW